VIFQKHVCSEELQVEMSMQAVITEMEDSGELNRGQVSLKAAWGSSLMHLDDLGYDSSLHLPKTFTQMRKETSSVQIRPLLPSVLKGKLDFPMTQDWS